MENRVYNIPPDLDQLEKDFEKGANGDRGAPTVDIYGTDLGFEVEYVSDLVAGLWSVDPH